MSIAVTGVIGCAPSRQEYEEQAARVLEEKYGEEFEVREYLGKQGMNEYYDVIAFSKAYPDILFEAQVACDGSYVSDEYVASRVCRKAEEQIEGNLSGLSGYKQIKVLPVSMSIDSENADMTMQEFMSLKTKNRFAVYLMYCPAQMDAGKAYQAITASFTGLECMSGNIQLYLTDERILKQVQEYLAEHAEPEYGFEEALEFAEPITIPFENGEIMLPEAEFLEKAGGQL